jgi:hypothetical protein
MKTKKQLLLVAVAMMLVISSCTLEKRLYSSGYHIDWKNGKRVSSLQKIAKEDLKTQKTFITTIEQTETVLNANTPIVVEDNSSLLVKTKNSEITKNEKNRLLSNQIVTTNEKEIKIVPLIKSELKKKLKKSKKTDEESKMSGMAIAGFVCGILGLIFVLITGWPFLLGTLGVIFSGIGMSQTSKGMKGKGFAIAGLISGILAILLFWALVILIATFFL